MMKNDALHGYPRISILADLIIFTGFLLDSVSSISVVSYMQHADTDTEQSKRDNDGWKEHP